MLPHESSIDRRLHGELHMIQWPIWCEHHESSSLLAIGICVFPARCSKSTASPQQPPYFHRRTQKHAGEGQLEMGLSADQEPKRWWIMIPCILLNEVMHATLQKMNKHYSYQKSKLFAARLKLHWNLDPKMESQKQWWFQDALRPIHAYIYKHWCYISICLAGFNHAAMELPKKETALISSKKCPMTTSTVLRVGPYLPSHDGNSKDVSMKID